jgi:hypothetical protein
MMTLSFLEIISQVSPEFFTSLCIPLLFLILGWSSISLCTIHICICACLKFEHYNWKNTGISAWINILHILHLLQHLPIRNFYFMYLFRSLYNFLTYCLLI